MKPVVGGGASRETWSTRYEHLRAGWLTHELTWGQALLVRQGMVAWMQAWFTAEPPQVGGLASIVPDSAASPPIAMGGELQRQLACELANWILHRQQEVLA